MLTRNIAERIGGAKFEESAAGYKFAQIKALKTAARAAHPELPLIDLGVGEPDLPADPRIVEVLAREAGKAENRYYADNGIEAFQVAAAGYLEAVYGLKDIRPKEQILHGIGSKPILAMLPLTFINPGDITLTTVPGYPIMATYTRYLGGEVFDLPLRAENDFYPDLERIPPEILARAKMLYLNYPNNPTGQIGTVEFYRRVVDFALKNRLVVVSDASYAAIRLDGGRPLSFLSVDGAWEVGVEIHSLSKAFNMTGWRLAFAVGNPTAIKAYGMIKDNTDSGQFRAIQKAGIFALNHPEMTFGNNERYSRRMDLLVGVLREIGFSVEKPKGTFYCYAPIPKGTKAGLVFNNAEEAAGFLIDRALISTVPWDDAGSYLRFSVTFEAEDTATEKNIIDEIKWRLLGLELVF